MFCSLISPFSFSGSIILRTESVMLNAFSASEFSVDCQFCQIPGRFTPWQSFVYSFGH